MPTTMEKNGYVADVEFSPDDRIFHGKVLLVRDLVTFEGKSVRELEREFTRSLETYLEVCEEQGQEPEKPYSGKFQVRMSPEEHRAAAIEAAKAGKSLNAWIVEAVRARSW